MRFLLAMLFGALLLPGQSPDKRGLKTFLRNHEATIEIAAGQALDLGTTLYALSSGAREANPVLVNSRGEFRSGLFAGTTVGMTLLAHWIERKHPRNKALKWTGRIILGTKIGVAAHNIRAARSMQPLQP